MKYGTPVFLARLTDAGEVEVVEARVEGPGPDWTYLDRTVGKDGRSRSFPTKRLHATRSAALHALAEDLEERAREDRRLGAEFVTRAERQLVQAAKAKRMAEGGER